MIVVLSQFINLRYGVDTVIIQIFDKLTWHTFFLTYVLIYCYKKKIFVRLILSAIKQIKENKKGGDSNGLSNRQDWGRVCLHD
jgi:hypothetical protein